MSVPTRGWIVFAVVGILAAAVDLATKSAAFAWLGMPGSSRGFTIVPGFLVFETNLNEGALFGMGQGFGLGFAAVSVVAIAGIIGVMTRPATRDDPLLVIALALVVGGIVGNLFDRLGLPGLAWHAPPDRAGTPVLAVRDWIHFMLPGLLDWPIFNLADTWLVIGAGLLVLLSLRPPAAEFPRATEAP
jgi:signal peptidase II